MGHLKTSRMSANGSGVSLIREMLILLHSAMKSVQKEKIATCNP